MIIYLKNHYVQCPYMFQIVNFVKKNGKFSMMCVENYDASTYQTGAGNYWIC